MMLKSFILPAFLGCILLYIGYVLGEDLKLTPFGKKVRSLLSDDTFTKIFTFNAKSDDQLKEATQKALKKFYAILGLPYEENYEKRIEKEDEDIGLKNVTAEEYFQSQTYALGRCFRDNHILNDSNIDDIAQRYVDQLDEAAKQVSDPDDIVQVFVAQATAQANILKEENVTSEEQIKKCEKYFSEKLKKNEKKKDS